MEWNCFSVVVLLFSAFVLSQNHNALRVSLSWRTFSLWNLQGTSSYWVRKSVRKKLSVPGRSEAFQLNHVSVNELHPIPQIQDFWPTEGAWYINRTTLKSPGGATRAEEVFALVRRILCWSSQAVLFGEEGGPPSQWHLTWSHEHWVSFAEGSFQSPKVTRVCLRVYSMSVLRLHPHRN